jgi:hypothetical protein
MKMTARGQVPERRNREMSASCISTLCLLFKEKTIVLILQKQNSAETTSVHERLPFDEKLFDIVRHYRK